MATTFIGKAAGAADPKMDHESVLAACTQTYTFVGKAANTGDPTIIGCIPKLTDIDDEGMT